MGALSIRDVRKAYHGTEIDLFFALEAWDTLYLKADAESERPFVDAGCERFIYRQPNGKTFSMGYWTVPDEALDSPAAMAPWARLAIDCALRNRKPPAGQRRRG